jgi:geranylgeranyl diphosphate synthase type I
VLCLLGAQAAGCEVDAALPAAVAVELAHNFSLLHDDVMDHDEERRHRPTAWAVFGDAAAILGGDALVILAQAVLLGAASPHRGEAAAVLADATTAMVTGQARDMAFESQREVSIEDCLEMVAGKTAALLSCSSALGAVLGGGPAEISDGLRQFGFHVGVAFQAIDDILGIWGRPEVTGKPAGNDLRHAKKTLPVVAALAARTERSEHLAALLDKARLDDGEIVVAAGLVDECGGRAWTVGEAERQADLALRALDQCLPPPEVRDAMADIVSFVTARDY